MKWFRHNVDSHINLKHRDLMVEFGLEGYAIYWICLEFIAHQGHNYRLNGSKSWKKALLAVSNIECQKLEKILYKMGELNLICHKSLEKGDLYIPKMKEYSDEYTKRIRRISEQGADKVSLQYNTLQDITIHYITKKGWYGEASKNKDLMNELFKRNVSPIKKLYILAQGDKNRVLEAIDWFGGLCDKKGLSWTIETIIKWYPEFLVRGKTDSYDNLLMQFKLKKE